MKKKEKQKKTLIYDVIITILIIIIGFCGFKIGKILYEYHKGTSAYESIAALAGADEKSDKLEISWKELASQNSDIKGWLYSKDTMINYPVVQGKDNDYYLYRMFNGEYNGKGSLFIDYQVKEPFKQFNTLIYGHRMKDGSMFKSLIQYRDNENYYEQHKVMQLYTPDQDYNVEIIGAATIPADSPMYEFDEFTDEEKIHYIDWIKEHNEIKKQEDVPVGVDDRLIMMSTCDYVFEDARLVVWGKLVPIAAGKSDESKKDHGKGENAKSEKVKEN